MLKMQRNHNQIFSFSSFLSFLLSCFCFFFFQFIFIYVCIRVGMSASAQRGHQVPWLGPIGSWCAQETWTQGLWKSSKSYSLQSRRQSIKSFWTTTFLATQTINSIVILTIAHKIDAFTYKIHFGKTEELETFGCSRRLKVEGGYGRGAGEERGLA